MLYQRTGRAMLAALLIATILTAVGGAGPASAATACAPEVVTQRGLTWRVAPSGGDDTANLQCALDEASAANGRSQILLADGTYHTGFLAVEDWRGSLIGAGVGTTIVENIPGLDCIAREDEVGSVDLLTLVGGDVAIANFSFVVNEGACAEPWFVTTSGPFPAARSDLRSLINMRPLLGVGCDTGDVTTRGLLDVAGVAFHSTQPDFEAELFSPETARRAIVYGQVDDQLGLPGCPMSPAMTGSLRVTGNEFIGFGGGIVAEHLLRTRVRVNENLFDNTDTATFVADAFASDVAVANNSIDVPDRPPFFGTAGPVNINGCTGPDPRAASTTIRVIGNHISKRQPGDAIVALDCSYAFGGVISLDSRIAGNHIHLEGGATGVLALFTNGGRVYDNTFTGSADVGVLIGTVDDFPFPATGMLVSRNRFEGLDVASAHVLLLPESTGNTVVAREGDIVVDLGVDNRVLGP